jgi:outer membrane protein TolC
MGDKTYVLRLKFPIRFPHGSNRVGTKSLAATTAESGYLAIETRQLLTLTEEGVTIYTKLLELVKVADLDVAAASYELNEAQSQLANAQGLYSEARRALEVLVGRYPAVELEVAEAFASVPTSDNTPSNPESMSSLTTDYRASHFRTSLTR